MGPHGSDHPEALQMAGSRDPLIISGERVKLPPHPPPQFPERGHPETRLWPSARVGRGWLSTPLCFTLGSVPHAGLRVREEGAVGPLGLE